jgi:2-keto-4-pentenoate hydratase
MGTTKAVEVLWQGVTEGRFDPGELGEDLSVDDGERLQLALLDRWCDEGEALGGWKVGLTSGRSRDAFGVGIRPFGFVLAGRIMTSGASVEAERIHRCGIETELSFRIGRELSGSHVTAADARGVVDAVAPAFEINERRIDADASPGARVADDLAQWGIVVGDDVSPVPADFDFEGLLVEMRFDGELVDSVAARGHIDDHFVSIARLAQELAKFDLGLEPGQRIITGAFTRHQVQGSGEWEGRFGSLGGVAVRFD